MYNININSEKNMKEESTMTNIISKNNNTEVSDMADSISKNNNTEVSDMAGSISNNNNMAKTLDMEIPENLSELISEDEQAVTELSVNGDDKVAVVETLPPLTDITNEISDEERGTEEKECTVELAEAKMCGCFNPALGMTGLVLSTGHRLYAKICTDAKGNRFIEYCQQYNDNSVSTKMRIRQADLMMAASCGFSTQKLKDAKMKNRVTSFIMKAGEDYFSKILLPLEAIKILDILSILIQQYNSLNVEQENENSKLEHPNKLYPAVISLIKKNRLDVVDERNASVLFIRVSFFIMVFR